MSIGDFLATFAEYLWELFPARLVCDWQQGILVQGGRITRSLTSGNGLRGTGWHFFVPVLQEIVVAETNIEVLHTPVQTQTTKDGRVVTFNFAVQFKIKSLRKLWVTLHDHQQEVLTSVCASAGGLVRACDFDEAMAGLPELVSVDLRDRFAKWGLELQSLELISFAACRALRLIGL